MKNDITHIQKSFNVITPRPREVRVPLFLNRNCGGPYFSLPEWDSFSPVVCGQLFTAELADMVQPSLTSICSSAGLMVAQREKTLENIKPVLAYYTVC